MYFSRCGSIGEAVAMETLLLCDQSDADTDSKIDQIDADIMDYTDTDFTTACNMLPNIVALPVCV